eukprot:266877-Lingulodinium_polyedra.AAC.1
MGVQEIIKLIGQVLEENMDKAAIQLAATMFAILQQMGDDVVACNPKLATLLELWPQHSSSLPVFISMRARYTAPAARADRSCHHP